MIYETGKLSTGKQYEIIDSAESAVREGSHRIAHVLSDPELTMTERQEILGIGLQHALKNAFESEHFRVAINGLAQGTLRTVHVHIILPRGKDTLPRLVTGITE